MAKWIDRLKEAVSRGDLQYTGVGSDGKVQPSRPTAIMQDPKTGKPIIVHENELVGTNGAIVPSKETSFLLSDYSKSKKKQEQLAKIEQKYGLSGYATGRKSDEPLSLTGFDPSGGANPTTVTQTPQITTQPQTTQQQGDPNAPVNLDMSGYVPGTITNVTNPIYTGPNRLPNYTNPNISLSGYNPAAGASPTTTQQAPTQIVQGTESPESIRHRFTLGETVINPRDQYWQQGMSTLSGITAGTDPSFKRIQNNLLDRQSTGFAAQGMALSQQQAQNPYLSQGAQATQQASLVRDQNAQRSILSGDINKQAQERIQDAANSLIDQSLNASEFDLDTQRFGLDVAEFEREGDETEWERDIWKYKELISTGTPENIQEAVGLMAKWGVNINPDDLISLGGMRRIESTIASITNLIDTLPEGSPVAIVLGQMLGGLVTNDLGNVFGITPTELYSDEFNTFSSRTPSTIIPSGLTLSDGRTSEDGITWDDVEADARAYLDKPTGELTAEDWGEYRMGTILDGAGDTDTISPEVESLVLNYSQPAFDWLQSDAGLATLAGIVSSARTMEGVDLAANDVANPITFVDDIRQFITNPSSYEGDVAQLGQVTANLVTGLYFYNNGMGNMLTDSMKETLSSFGIGEFNTQTNRVTSADAVGTITESTDEDGNRIFVDSEGNIVEPDVTMIGANPFNNTRNLLNDHPELSESIAARQAEAIADPSDGIEINWNGVNFGADLANSKKQNEHDFTTMSTDPDSVNFTFQSDIGNTGKTQWGRGSTINGKRIGDLTAFEYKGRTFIVKAVGLQYSTSNNDGYNDGHYETYQFVDAETGRTIEADAWNYPISQRLDSYISSLDINS
jgi:hypothetical protein